MYYIGIMSGTSLDAIDIVIIRVKPFKIIDYIAIDYPKKIKFWIRDLVKKNFKVSLKKLCKYHNNLAEEYGKGVNFLLKKANLSPKDIIAICMHGQTILHIPNDKSPFSFQIGNPNLVTAKTSIRTIFDFRGIDIAYGGQGAPLAPFFHQAFFHNEDKNRLIINLGGIANISYVSKNKDILIGFDSGPANCLIDMVVNKYFGMDYDNNGILASKGSIDNNLLYSLLDDDFFKKEYPKSTGTEYFNLDWVNKITINGIGIYDILRTLLALTVETIYLSCKEFEIDEIFISGGGAKNNFLVSELKKKFYNIKLSNISNLGVPCHLVEAVGFAYLGYQFDNNIKNNNSVVTNSSKNLILGSSNKI